jgi:D-alanyl-D-alanine carboxypeptidase (penicillin-binding protein 5/6)
MFARQHRKHRFNVDLVQSPHGRPASFRTGVVHRHAKRRSHFQPSERLQQRSRPFRPFRGFPPVQGPRAIARLHLRPRLTAPLSTLAQRRSVRRAALLLTLACAVLITAVWGSLSLASRLPHARTAAPALSGAVGGHEGGSDRERARTQRDLATRPFASLEPHAASANGPRPPAVRAAAAFLFDPGRGWILYEKHADEERSIASLTKVMTLLVASDAGEAGDLDRPVTVGPAAAARVNGANSYMGLSAGERLALRDLLFGLMVGSGNDAAVAVAESVGGSEASFVAMMNRRAWRLGLTRTAFVSPDGLDDNNRSTARDLAVLAAVALERADVERITATRHYSIPRTATHKAYELWSANDLLPGGRAPYPGANGVRTGYTAGASYCLAFSAQRGGHLLVGVVLGDPSAEARVRDAHALLDWGFAQE